MSDEQKSIDCAECSCRFEAEHVTFCDLCDVWACADCTYDFHRHIAAPRPCGCGEPRCLGVNDASFHQCGGPAEACMVAGCAECGA